MHKGIIEKSKFVVIEEKNDTEIKKIFIFITGLCLLFLLIFSSLMFLNVEAKTITVDDSGGADYKKIQEAIDTATEGDTIRVFEGNFHENINLNKTLILVGNGSTVTIIDGENIGDVVRISADRVKMSGFYLKHGGNRGYPDYDCGIEVLSNNNTLFDNTIVDNKNYGIRLHNSSYNSLMNNTCINNLGFGIALETSSNHNIITNNTCTISGRDGIYLLKSNINNLTYNNCSYNDYDGIFLSSSIQNTLSNNIFNNNKFGVFFLSSSNNIIINNTISNNEIVGIFLEDTSRNIIAHYNNIFENGESVNTLDNEDNPIDARYNWWGDTTGPYHYINNTNGRGNNVTNNVDFLHWLDKPFEMIVNKEPISYAGYDQTVNTNDVIRFFGTARDIDGKIMKYEWDFDGDGTYDWESTTTGETTNVYYEKGTYHVKLRVTDNDGIPTTDICIINVMEQINNPPTINLTFPYDGATIYKRTRTIIINGTASDDKYILYVQIKIDDGDWKTCIGMTNWSFTWNLTNVTEGIHTISIKAFDGNNFSETKTISVDIVEKYIEEGENQIPLIILLIIFFFLLILLFTINHWYGLIEKRKIPHKKIEEIDTESNKEEKVKADMEETSKDIEENKINMDKE